MKGFIIKNTTVNQLERMMEDTLRVHNFEQEQQRLQQQQNQQQMQENQLIINQNQNTTQALFTDEIFRQQMFDNIWMNM